MLFEPCANGALNANTRGFKQFYALKEYICLKDIKFQFVIKKIRDKWYSV